MARPRKSTNVLEILRLRLEGLSGPQIAHSTGLGQGTVYRAYRKAIDALKPFQNPKAAKLKGRVTVLGRCFPVGFVLGPERHQRR